MWTSRKPATLKDANSFSDPMTHSAPSGGRFQKMIQKVKKESSDSSSCQKGSNIPLSEQWDRTIALSSFVSTDNTSSSHYPEMASKNGILQRVNTNAGEYLGNAVSASTTKNSPRVVPECYDYSVMAQASTTSRRKLSPKYATAVKFIQGESCSPATKILRSDEGQGKSEGQLGQKMKEWKERQALWQSSVRAHDQGIDMCTRFALPRNFSDVIPYDFETSRFPMSSDANYHNTGEDGNCDAIGRYSRAEINVNSSRFLCSDHREDSETVASYVTCKPVIKEVVSLAKAQPQNHTNKTFAKRRKNRSRKTQGRFAV